MRNSILIFAFTALIGAPLLPRAQALEAVDSAVANEDEAYWTRLLQQVDNFSIDPTPRPNLRPTTEPPTPEPPMPDPPTPRPPTASAPTPVPIDTPAQLSVDIIGPGASFADQMFDYSVTATNTGGDTATGVILTVNLPTEGSFVSSDPGGEISGNTLTVQIGNLDGGNSFALLIKWQAPNTETTLTAIATVSADNAEAVSVEEQVEVGIASLVTGSVTSAGTALRNRVGGTISITEIPVGATITRAVLVWVILYDPLDGVPSNQITFDGSDVTANLEQSISNSLCWNIPNDLSDLTIGYAADVTSLVTGNGDYRITNTENGIVNEDSDPLGILPYTDGASLFVFYGGPGITNQVLFDFSYDAISGDGSRISRTLTGINSVGGMATLHLAGPDGQDAGEDITVAAMGSGMLSFDNTWDGSAPIDGPDFIFEGRVFGNLWDNDIHDVTSILPSGQTSMDVVIESKQDCIGLSAVVLEVEQE